MSQLLTPLDDARAAAERRAWREAYDLYTRVEGASPEAADLERFGEAAFWVGRLEEAVALRERAYAGYASAGAKVDASRLALTLSWDHVGRGEFAVAHGWFANAERLLEGQPDTVEHARLTLTRGFNMLFAGAGVDDAVATFERAYDLGERFGDRDTQVLSLVGKGRALIRRGDVDDGLALLDEATATCGHLNAFATGLVHCVAISSYQDVGDFRRAAECTVAANRWCDALDVTGYPGSCRVHRAEMLRLRGEWPQAEELAQAACEEVQQFDRRAAAGGHYEIGEIRRRRGEFAAAEEAFRTANELGREPQPGLALLRLAEGKVEAAVAGIRRALQEGEEPFTRVRLLPAQVEVSLAASDLRTARAALAELEGLVDAYKIDGRRAPAFDAAVDVAAGRIAVAEGDPDEAARRLRHARDEWQRIGAPYETAQARMLLGLAFRRQGDEHGATDELEAALATFERLGATLDAERTKELLGRLEARRTFLFTDIVDSTRMLETLGDEKWRKLLARHDELLRERIVESGGEVIKQTGDGFFAAFDTPKAAIEAAVAIQRALDAEIVAPDVRIGAHTGGAFRSGGDVRDYGGQGVHVAARIGAAAAGGEILVSSDTLDGVATAFRASEPRSEVLAGFEQPIDVVSIDWR
ncbi:MAG TPA: adenylate/guanylate cyclase domain-containing protein [Gaiellaceae bacterium]|nr:adenylate/guanylate cyclase domain-containing protein [Gaiellaceae bacterium]